MIREQTWGEEIANSLSHGVGLLLAIASLPILVQHAASRGGTADVVGASLFAGTAIALYLVSTLYHSTAGGPAKTWLNRLDHASIYLFIAGSYMPFLLGVLVSLRRRTYGSLPFEGRRVESLETVSTSHRCIISPIAAVALWPWQRESEIARQALIQPAEGSPSISRTAR